MSVGAEELFDQRRGGFEVFAMVGDVDSAAVRREDAGHFFQRFGADDPAFLIALSRPRIGEVDVDLVDRLIGEHVAQDEKSVVIDESHVGEISFGRSLANHSIVVKRFLDADEVRVGLLDC